MAREDTGTRKANAESAASKRAAFVGACGNYSIALNFTALSPALKIMASKGDEIVKGSSDFPEPEWAVDALNGLVFAGALVGMLVMGYAADVVGRRRGMLLTLAFVLVGALGSALATFGSAGTVYATLGFFRFVLGIGAGGIYPIAAATAAEAGGNDAADPAKAGQKAAWAFLWQSVGAFSAYLLAWVLVAAMPHGGATLTSWQFRILLGSGAVPAAIVFLATYYGEEKAPTAGSRGGKAGGKAGGGAAGPLAAIRQSPEHLRTLIGTAGIWLLYDVAYYGTVIFQPSIINSIFGSSDLSTQEWQNMATSAMGIAGALASMYGLRVAGSRRLTLGGFGLMGALFASLALAYVTGASDGAKFALLCFLTFSFQFCNTSTYVVPAEVYPSEVRTTFHGLSAAGGKLGAVFGTYMFPVLSDTTGVSGVLWFQTAMCAAGLVVAFVFIKGAPAGSSSGGGAYSLVPTAHGSSSSAADDSGVGGDDDSYRSMDHA